MRTIQILPKKLRNTDEKEDHPRNQITSTIPAKTISWKGLFGGLLYTQPFFILFFRKFVEKYDKNHAHNVEKTHVGIYVLG